jgi:hypothetical protein
MKERKKEKKERREGAKEEMKERKEEKKERRQAAKEEMKERKEEKKERKRSKQEAKRRRSASEARAVAATERKRIGNDTEGDPSSQRARKGSVKGVKEMKQNSISAPGRTQRSSSKRGEDVEMAAVV